MANLDSMRRELERKVSRVAAKVAREVEQQLEANAPVDSGNLRRLITTAVRASATGATIDIESGADYAEFVRAHRADWDRIMQQLPGMIQRAWRGAR